MFSLKSKLDPNLRHALDGKLYKSYRVNILCRNLQENIEKKIKSYKGIVVRSIYTSNITCAILTAHAIERLIEYPEISYIAIDSQALLCGTSVLTANGIRFQERYRLTGKGVGIGIVDSGIYPHPDLMTPYNKVKFFMDLINGFKYPYDDNGHGTFISGLISGSGHHSKGMYRGVAENSSLYCIKAFNSIGRGFVSDILFSIETLLNKSEEFNLKVLCLPFELLEYNHFVLTAFSKLFDEAVKKNIIPVVPSGNNGQNECSLTGIAMLPNCITVGGLDTTNSPVPYRYSSSGPGGKQDKPDLSAACVNICSLNANTDYISERNGKKLFPHTLEKHYTNYTGTSCGAAFISGICALLFENNPELAFKDISSLLKVSCSMLNMSKWAQGSGTINIQKLLP
jgi:serine protease AprX